MMCVTRADHDTDRLDQSMTVNGYDLVSICTVCLSGEVGLSDSETHTIRLGVLR